MVVKPRLPRGREVNVGCRGELEVTCESDQPLLTGLCVSVCFTDGPHFQISGS